MDKSIVINTFCNHPKTTLRVDKSVAKELLLENFSLIVGGTVRYFIIKDLGLGVCEIGLRESGKVNTFVTKKYWMEERAWAEKG